MEKQVGRTLSKLLKDEEPALYKISEKKKTLQIEISESDIITLINSIPTVYHFNTKEFETAEILLDLIGKLRQEWKNA